MELALLVAWLVIHAVYRGGVGTYCAVKKIEPPWVKNRTERLVNREIRQGRRYEALRSRRTLRGFFGRLWGDLWEDANQWKDERRQERLAWHLNGSPRRSWRDRVGQWRDAAQPGMRTRLLGLWAQEWWQRARQWGERWMAASRARSRKPDDARGDASADGVVIPKVPDMDTAAEYEPAPMPKPQTAPGCRWNQRLPDIDYWPCGQTTEPGEPFCPDHTKIVAQRREALDDDGRTPPQPEPVATAEPQPTGRPPLRAVPDPPTQQVIPPAAPETQGAPPMTAPTEITNVQRVRQFAEQVEKHGNEDWPAKLNTAEQQITTIGLHNDPDITTAFGEMREAAQKFAAAGAALGAALPKHEDAAERITGLGDAAATNITAYQNQ